MPSGHTTTSMVVALLLTTLALTGWSVAMPQLRRMVLGPDVGMDELRREVARTLASFPK
uniref:Phosphatidic acid phosphatase type 2/haloperoxidase domain-containing protein n=2 Tax=unclassified Streptomyces TaxID=2593676 RepID=A0AAU1UGV3_9ACTN